jgi:Family of unknown function (DUF5715)
MAFFCLALLPLPLHASNKQKHKSARKAAPTQTIQPHGRTAPAHRKPRIIVATPRVGNQASLDAATADRVHAFIAAQQHEHAAQPVPAAATNVVTVARGPADRRQLPPVQEVAAAPVQEVASAPVLLPTLYNKRGRLIVPPPLKGSHEILVHQNEVADRDGLARIQDDADLERMRREGLLVALPIAAGLQVDERLPANRRYCRPWTADFLSQLSREFYARFQTPLQVNSAVRTVEFQQHLMHINGNAAPAEGDTASPHLTGQAVDIAKHGLSLTQIAWLRGYLLPLVQEGKIDVEEEFQQACFHISVYKSYVRETPAMRHDLASTHHDRAAELAVAVR